MKFWFSLQTTIPQILLYIELLVALLPGIISCDSDWTTKSSRSISFVGCYYIDEIIQFTKFTKFTNS